MPLIINGQVATGDTWQLLNEETIADATGDVIVPFALFAEHKDTLNVDKVALGVDCGDDVNAVLAIADQFELIAINFPALRDGRGFSIATHLRRAGFKGQIRAIGDVSHDRLGYMSRCGFDAYVIPDDRYNDEALAVFSEISVHYQGAADASRPVYHQ